MKIAVLFGGQGSQQEGMGKDLYGAYESYRNLFDSIDLDFPLAEYSFYGDLTSISKTEYTQPIMVAFQIGLMKILEEHGLRANYLAGFSIGEYSALAVAQVIGSMEAIEIARVRGKAMALDMDSKMMAVLGLGLEEIRLVLDEVNSQGVLAEVSNLNCPGQVVISGHRLAVERAACKFEKLGAKRLIDLNVSGPFHTSYMEGASQYLKGYFKDIDFKDESIPIVYNLLGRERESRSIEDIMVDQVKSTVLFQESINYMLKQGVDTFLELGFSDVLKKFVKKVDRKAKVYSVYDLASLDNFLKEVSL